MKENYYKPSGRFNARFFLFFLLFVVISIPILSTAYIYLIYYIPIVYLNVLITAGCGAVLGFIIGKAARLGKVRNPVLVIVCVLAATIVLKYVQWSIYIPLVFDDAYALYGEGITLGERFVESLYFFTTPADAYEAASIINEVGVWGLSRTGSESSDSVNGIMLLIVWVGELVLIAGMAILFSRKQCTIPFSETTDTWYSELDTKIDMELPLNVDSFRSEMENGRFDTLIQLAETGKGESTQFLTMTIYEPPESADREPHYISLEQTKIGKRNKSKTKKLIRHLAIDKQNVDIILGRTSRV